MLTDVDFNGHTVRIMEKGGQRRCCLVSKEGMHAVQDYLDQERAQDTERWGLQRVVSTGRERRPKRWPADTDHDQSRLE
jgi:site-specific recombinase XerD